MDITITQVLSFVVPAMGLAKSWVYGNKWKYAPAYGMVVQVGWIIFTLHLGMQALGMICLATTLFFVELRNLIKWMKEAK